MEEMEESGCNEMQVVKHSKGWIIICNLRQAHSHQPTGTALKSHLKMVVDACWAGNRWQPLIGYAQKFDSRNDAEQYLARHRAAMAKAPVLSST